MALLTLDDFLKINKENHDLRARERAEDLDLLRQERAADTAVRAKERSEDFEKLSGMIDKSVKSQIGCALQPVVERQEDFESKTDEKLIAIEKRLDAMLDSITNKPTSQYPPLPPSSAPSIFSAGPVLGPHPAPPQSQQTPPYSETELTSIKSIISHARTIVGLGPVTPTDIEGLGHDNPAKGLRLVALEILRMDLNIKEHEIAADDIAATFTPVGFPQPPRVYVRFYKQEHADLCLSVAKRLKNPEVKVCRYFPRQFIERYKALENEAYPLRYPRSVPGFKTEVVFKEDDIELLICPNGHFRYRPHPVHGLPPIDLAPVRSPPKGRQNKRGRSDSNSPKLERKTGRFNSPHKADEDPKATSEDDDTAKMTADEKVGDPENIPASTSVSTATHSLNL